MLKNILHRSIFLIGPALFLLGFFVYIDPRQANLVLLLVPFVIIGMVAWLLVHYFFRALNVADSAYRMRSFVWALTLVLVGVFNSLRQLSFIDICTILVFSLGFQWYLKARESS